MASHYEFEIDLSPNNFRKLMKHQNTMLKNSQLGKKGKHSIFLSEAKAKRMHRALRQGKGIKIVLSPDELEETMTYGKGFKDMLKRGARFFNSNIKPEIKKGIHKIITTHGDKIEEKVEKVLEKKIGKTASKNIAKAIKPALHKGVNALLGEEKKAAAAEAVDDLAENFLTQQGFGHKGGKISLKDIGNAYKKYVKPIAAPLIRKGLKTAIKTGIPALASAVGQPELGVIGTTIADKYADKAIDSLGKATGAFGVKRRGKTKGGQIYYGDENLIAYPSKNTNIVTGLGARRRGGRLKSDYSTFLDHEHPAMNPGDTRYTMSGGSFKPSGYGLRGGSFVPAGY